jgi:hypothetical protein
MFDDSRPKPSKIHSQASVSTGPKLTEDEVDAMIDEFAKDDDYKMKTWSRRVVENFLQNVSLKRRETDPNWMCWISRLE